MAESGGLQDLAPLAALMRVSKSTKLTLTNPPSLQASKQAANQLIVDHLARLSLVTRAKLQMDCNRLAGQTSLALIELPAVLNPAEFRASKLGPKRS